MLRDIPERDWKVLRDLKPVALERFCQRVFDKIARLGADSSRGSHERYLDLYELIKDQDKKLAATFDGLSRSSSMLKLFAMHRQGLLTDEELSRFTPDTREALELLGKTL